MEFYETWMVKTETTSPARELAYIVKSLIDPLARSRRVGSTVVRGSGCALWVSRNQRRALEAFSALLAEPLALVQCDTSAPLGPMSLRSVATGVMAGMRYALGAHERRHPPIERLRLFRVAVNASILLDAWMRWLQAQRPSIVLVSNDHMVACRAIAHAAQCTGTPVGYVQHASVTGLFPSLRCFDVAFLDGARAEEIYRAKGDADRVTLVRTGAVRNFALHRARENPKPRSGAVGVAINVLLDDARLERLLKMLGAAPFASRVVLRPHPGQRLDPAALPSGAFAIDGSASIEEFLRTVDVVICGSTSTPMEAVAAGVPCFYYQLEADDVRDYYGFMRSGALPELTSASDLAPALDAPETWARAQRLRFAEFDDACVQGVDAVAHRVRQVLAEVVRRAPPGEIA